MKEPELSLEEIDVLFLRLKKMGVQRLGLLGGEPLYRKDFSDILKLAKRYGFFVSLNSNLLLYEKFKNDLDAVDYFFTSLDGSPERHIRNRGKQSYDTILAAIRDIKKRGKPLTAICVVTDLETKEADYLLALAERERITIHFQPECYDTQIVLRSASDAITQEKGKAFWKYLLSKKKSGAPISSSAPYLRYICEWDNYRQSAVFDSGVQCAAGRGFLFVDATGAAYPCAYTKGKTEGINLLQDDWQTHFTGKTPCTKCIVGPMLEFNLLFDKPFASVANVLYSIRM
jgi:Predicted Fe-S oxidoreductases